MELILNGVSIPTDGSGRVLITDINTNGESNHEALVCQTKLSSEISSYSYWSLNNVTIGTAVDTQGWKIDDFQSGETVLVRLIRISDAAKEGVFTCHIDEKSIALGVYYPSEFDNCGVCNYNMTLYSHTDHYCTVISQ